MHNIKIGHFQFQLPGSYEDLTDQMCLHLIECHAETRDEDIKTLFLIKTVGKRVYLLNRLNEVQLAQIITLLDWMRVDNLPALPLVKSIKVNNQIYHSPKSSMKLMSGIEYSMLDMYYNQLQEKPEKLDDLCAVYFRELDGEKRCKLEEEGIEKRKELFKNLDPRQKLSALLYMTANKNLLAKKYKPIFQGGSGGKDPLGWAGTFIAIAETGIIGDLEKVKETPITEICLILVKKHYDKIETES
ncbi:hypothetical protein [Flexithrix dorotheae]|uniref:hypothetical protein n=1 Tax=Flexithrix dorotheae TaxID=70993 RepID=UPI000363CBC6|nr:hypothetical protein [Flexithrix dorotheae]